MYKNPYGGRISVLGIDKIYYIVYLKEVGAMLKDEPGEVTEPRL